MTSDEVEYVCSVLAGFAKEIPEDSREYWALERAAHAVHFAFSVETAGAFHQFLETGKIKLETELLKQSYERLLGSMDERGAGAHDNNDKPKP